MGMKMNVRSRERHDNAREGDPGKCRYYSALVLVAQEPDIA
jgi:hypothetical protein